MEGIDIFDLFDRYFNGELSEVEQGEFKKRLESDDKFAADLKIYSITVAGICKEARQDNADFGIAMKHLSADKLREIIGRKQPEAIRSDITGILCGQAANIACANSLRTSKPGELTSAAAFNEIDDDQYDGDDNVANSSETGTADTATDATRGGKKSGSSSLLPFIIVVACVLLMVLLFSLM
ncbi:MAG: hypothetical protein ACI30K_06585 [Muribaculaceae bacterium]